MLRCKTREIMRNEAYFPYAAMTNDARNAADVRFSTACQSPSLPGFMMLFVSSNSFMIRAVCC